MSLCICRCQRTVTTASVGPISLSVVSGSATVSIIIQLKRATMIATKSTMLRDKNMETVDMTPRTTPTSNVLAGTLGIVRVICIGLCYASWTDLR